MLKKIILIVMMAVCILAAPGAAYAEEASVQNDGLRGQVLKILENMGTEYDVKTKYAVKKVSIYDAPSDLAAILDTSLKNTSFEVIYESGGWSIVTTQAGAAFIKSEYLSDEPVKGADYTEEDLYIMAHAITGESQNCSDQEQLYVGSVILNRVNHRSFPNTIKGVVFQKGQYACTRDGNYYREPTARNWTNARWLLENGSVLPSNVIWQSGRRQGKGVYIKTKSHYYCY